ENMALSLWKTLELYGLKGQIQAIVADNASNNDTMMEALGMLCAKEGILFSACEAWMRCIPHTVHLAALKLLEGLGAFSTSQRRGAEQANYQDAVTLPVTRESDADIVSQEDELEEEDDHMGPVLSAVAKVCVPKIFHGNTFSLLPDSQDHAGCMFQPSKMMTMAGGAHTRTSFFAA
ncbi:hypothetical protein JB92DRAFT_2733743, partial [Gautieria morchelliformis]